MRTRLNRSCIDFVNALNTIDIVFYDSKKVRAAYKELLEMYRLGRTDIEEHNIKNLKLIESIVQDVGYSKNINWNEISLPYNPKWFYDELDKQEKFKGIQLMMGDAISKYLNSASINETKGNQ